MGPDLLLWWWQRTRTPQQRARAKIQTALALRGISLRRAVGHAFQPEAILGYLKFASNLKPGIEVGPALADAAAICLAVLLQNSTLVTCGGLAGRFGRLGPTSCERRACASTS